MNRFLAAISGKKLEALDDKAGDDLASDPFDDLDSDYVEHLDDVEHLSLKQEHEIDFDGSDSGSPDKEVTSKLFIEALKRRRGY